MREHLLPIDADPSRLRLDHKFRATDQLVVSRFRRNRSALSTQASEGAITVFSVSIMLTTPYYQ